VRLAAIAVGIPVSALFLWLATRHVDLGEAVDALGNASVGWLIAGAVLLNATIWPLAARWRRVAQPVLDPCPPTLRFGEAITCAVAANNLLPARPGEPLRVYWLTRTGRVPAAASAAAVVVDRSADVIVLVAVVAASLPFVDRPRWLTALSLSAAVVAALLLVGLVAARWYTHRSRRGRARAEMAAEHRGRSRRLASGFVRTLSTAARPAQAARIVVPTLIAWALWAGGAWAIARSLGVHLSPAEAALLAGVVNLGIAIPSSPGFVGTFQWLVVSSLALSGVGRSTGFAVSVALHALGYIPPTLAGIALMPRMGLSLRRLPQAPEISARTSTTAQPLP
jgi:uncharacterized protein (TIRG00374 family)